MTLSPLLTEKLLVSNLNGGLKQLAIWESYQGNRVSSSVSIVTAPTGMGSVVKKRSEADSTS